MKSWLKTLDTVRVAQALFFLNAIIWLTLGIASLLRLTRGSGPISTMTALIVAVLMFGNVGAMVVSGIGLGTRRRGFYVLALTVLLINILLTFTDQFGLLDFFTLIIDLVLFGLLIAIGRQSTKQAR